MAGDVRVELVGSSPGSAVAAPGAVVAQHQIASRSDRIVAGRMVRQPGEPRRVGEEVEQGRRIDLRRSVQVGIVGLGRLERVVDVALEDQPVDFDRGTAARRFAPARDRRRSVRRLAPDRIVGQALAERQIAVDPQGQAVVDIGERRARTSRPA